MAVLDFVLDESYAARLLEARRADVRSLAAALESFAAEPDWRTLQEVVETLPPALGVDLAAVLVREDATPGRLRLVSASGLAGRDLGRLAFRPLTVSQARTVAAAAAGSVLAIELGLRWASGALLRDGGAVGMLYVGSRTRRRPVETELRALREVAAALGSPAARLDRRPTQVRRRASALARRTGLHGGSRVANLRAREAQILELYGDGLATSEIAELLVISQHTVRTHVRNALRRLEVHSRDDAVARLREWQVMRVLDEPRARRA